MNIKFAIIFILSCTLARGDCHENTNEKNCVEGNEMQCLTKEKLTLEKVVSQGMLEAFQDGAISNPLAKADFRNTSTQIIYAWGIDYAPLNGILEKNSQRIPTNEEIEQTIKYFGSKNLPFIWWTSAKVLETKGFIFGGILTGIARNMPHELTKPSAPANLKIIIVESSTDLESFAKINAEGANMNAEATEQWKTLCEAFMKQGKQVHFLAFLDGTPVGTASLSTSASIAGIWNLATLSEYRRQGIGASLVYEALAEAKKRHYKEVMAILMPKGMAWGLFTKLGFKAVNEFPFYIYGVSEELEK